MLTEMNMQGNDLSVTISTSCDSATARDCIQRLREISPGNIRSLNVTLTEIDDVPSSVVGLLLWLHDRAGARAGRLRLIRCDERIWTLLGMTDIASHYYLEGNTIMNNRDSPPQILKNPD